MKRFVLLCGIGLIALGLVACGGGGDSGSSAETASDTATETPTAGETHLAAQTVEMGCGACTYHMDGVETCTLAAKVDGTPMLVDGSDIDPHSSGLCAEPKMAVVTGDIADGRLTVTEVVLQ